MLSANGYKWTGGHRQHGTEKRKRVKAEEKAERRTRGIRRDGGEF